MKEGKCYLRCPMCGKYYDYKARFVKHMQAHGFRFEAIAKEMVKQGEKHEASSSVC